MSIFNKRARQYLAGEQKPLRKSAVYPEGHGRYLILMPGVGFAEVEGGFATREEAQRYLDTWDFGVGARVVDTETEQLSESDTGFRAGRKRAGLVSWRNEGDVWVGETPAGHEIDAIEVYEASPGVWKAVYISGDREFDDGDSHSSAEQAKRAAESHPTIAVRKQANKEAKNPQSGHGESELETPEHPNEHDPTAMWPWEIGEVEENRDIVGEGSKTAAATTDDFMRMARDKYAWPGGYEMFFITDDGGVLCHDCMVNEEETIREASPGDGWYVVEMDHTGNTDWVENCDHCGRSIPKEGHIASRNPMARNVWGQNQRTAVARGTAEVEVDGQFYGFELQQSPSGYEVIKRPGGLSPYGDGVYYAGGEVVADIPSGNAYSDFDAWVENWLRSQNAESVSIKRDDGLYHTVARKQAAWPTEPLTEQAFIDFAHEHDLPYAFKQDGTASLILPPDRKRERMEIADELGDRFQGIWDGPNTGVMPKEQGALITVKISASRNPMARNVWGQNQREAANSLAEWERENNLPPAKYDKELYRNDDGHEVWRIVEIGTGQVYQEDIGGDFDAEWILNSANYGLDVADRIEDGYLDKPWFMASKQANESDPDHVEVGDEDDRPMWPTELEGDPDTGEDAADVAGTPTPGQSVADYPQPTEQTPEEGELPAQASKLGKVVVHYQTGYMRGDDVRTKEFDNESLANIWIRNVLESRPGSRVLNIEEVPDNTASRKWANKDFYIGERVLIEDGLGDTGLVESWDGGWFVRLDDGELTGPWDDGELSKTSKKRTVAPRPSSTKGQKFLSRLRDGVAALGDEVEVRIYIPGEGTKRKQFATDAEAEAWVDQMLEEHGDDIQVSWGTY